VTSGLGKSRPACFLGDGFKARAPLDLGCTEQLWREEYSERVRVRVFPGNGIPINVYINSYVI
jgi:hypothetical protein